MSTRGTPGHMGPAASTPLLTALVTSLLAAATVLLGTAPPAAAHTDLLFTSPEEGAVLEVVPTEVELTFSEPVLPESVVVSVEDETGFVVRVLDLAVDGPDVAATWPPGMRGKEYSVNYRVVAEDGHPVEGTVHFSVTTAPTDGAVAVASPAVPVSSAPVPTLAASGTDGGGANLILVPLLVGLAVGIVAGLVLVAVSRSRRRAASDPEPGPDMDPGP